MATLHPDRDGTDARPAGVRSRARARLVVAGARSLRRGPSTGPGHVARLVRPALRRGALPRHGSLLQDRLKRATDLLLSVVLLVCLAPLFALAAVAIRLDSPGPVFFRQPRIGRDGREFTMLKFRSMALDATPDAHRDYINSLANATGDHSPGGLRKLTADRRVTRVGAILRKTSIDEAPQLINVLAGRMSIVGPRPALAYELEFYRPEHAERFRVRPGMTGLWQVSGRSQLGWSEMLELDIEYVRRQSFAYDMWLLLRTPWAVLSAHTA